MPSRSSMLPRSCAIVTRVHRRSSRSRLVRRWCPPNCPPGLLAISLRRRWRAKVTGLQVQPKEGGPRARRPRCPSPTGIASLPEGPGAVTHAEPVPHLLCSPDQLMKTFMAREGSGRVSARIFDVLMIRDSGTPSCCRIRAIDRPSRSSCLIRFSVFLLICAL